MPDIVDAATRSRMMGAIRSKDTRPEIRVRRRLHAAGLRYRLHVTDLPGKPDLVFIRARTIVFVHGCFWHQHPGCPFAVTPRSNVRFWTAKLRSNVERDARVGSELRRLGWHVELVWECDENGRLDALAASIASRGSRIEGASR